MRAAFDTGLDHHVDRAADDDQMLDVVAPHQHQPLLIDNRGLDHAEPASRAAASSRSLTQGKALDPPGGERDQRHHEQDGRDAVNESVESHVENNSYPLPANSALTTRGP